MDLFHKASLVVRGNIHDLLDKAIDANNPAALRQQARDLSEATQNLSNEAATQAGMVRTLTRERDAVKTKIAGLQAQGTKAKEANNTAVMLNIAGQIKPLQDQLAQKEAALTEQTQASQKIDASVSMLKSKLELVNAAVHNLEVMDSTSKAKAHAAAAMDTAASILDSTSDIDTDAIAQRIQQTNDVNSAKFERAMDKMNAASPAASADDPDISSIMGSF